MRLLIIASIFLVTAATAAIAEREISTSQTTAVFVGARGVTTDYERVYVADNGSGDVFIRRAIELSGFASASYVSLTNANAQQAVNDPDGVFVLPANILENGLFLPLFDNPSTVAFVPTLRGLEPVTVTRVDGLQIVSTPVEPRPESPLPVISLDDPSTLLVAVRGDFPNRLRLTSYRVRPDMALLTSRLQEASVAFDGVVPYQQGEDTMEILHSQGEGILFLPELLEDGPIRLLSQNGQTRVYALHALGISPVTLSGAATVPAEVAGAAPSAVELEPAPRNGAAATNPMLQATNPMAQADINARMQAILETRIADLARVFRQDHQRASWVDLNGPSTWVLFVSPEGLARAALFSTEVFRSEVPDPEALKTVPVGPLSLSEINSVILPAFGALSRHELLRQAVTAIEHDLVGIGISAGANDNGQPLTVEALEGPGHAIAVVSSDLLNIESWWQGIHRIPFILTSEGLQPVRLTNGAPPDTDNIYSVTDDLVARLEHRALRGNPSQPLFTVAVPRASGFGDRAVRFVSRLDRGAPSGTTTVQLRGEKIAQQTIQLLPQQLQRSVVEGLLLSYPVPVISSRTLSLPAFDPLFEGGYEFWDAEGRALDVPLLPQLVGRIAVDTEAEQQVTASSEICGISVGPIVVSREPISPGRIGTVVYPSGAPQLLMAIGSSSLANSQAIGQPFSDIRQLLQSGLAEVIVLPNPDAARSLGFDQACSSFVFSVLE